MAATTEVPPVPARPSPRTPRQIAAAVALSVMFLAVTKGPVFRIRYEVSAPTGDYIDDLWVQAAMMAATVPVLVLCWPAARLVARDRLVALSFAVLVGAVLASTLWSVWPSRSAEQAAMFAVGTAAALLAGAYVRGVDVMIALWVAMQIGVGASIVAAVRDWELAHHPYGQFFSGIYFNRNSLGPVALMGAAVSIALIALWWHRGGPNVVGAVLAVAAVVDLAVLRRAGSVTPAAAALVALVIAALVVLLVPGPRRRLRRRSAIVIGATLAVVGVAALVAPSTILGWTNRSSTLTGRTEIWDVVLDYSDDRPLQGWGFMAIWRRSDIADDLEAVGRTVFEAHSGYLEVLLGAGVIGLVALLAVVIAAVARSVAALWRQPTVVTAWAWWAVVYALTLNLTETYVGANLHPWILLSVATGLAVAVRAGRPDGARHGASAGSSSPEVAAGRPEGAGR